MASPLKFTVFSACVLVLCVVVAAQYDGPGNGSDMPKDMPMGPAPHSNASLTCPAIITILLPFMLAFLAAKERI
ncbi:hypothetical protein AAZX31_01G034500 [Glycine max]|uniref:Uncharacterized protein n=2 Tax=Glycine subgen. Soja TaxID=1462606 RepID=A0A0R0L626_SOYBN|nr:hypothetical protein JHK87_000346 [Glycine soja]KAG5067967.1 hypothetical protein JHK85_000344 [Glycine max]KAG5087729.1 hypothetical protein JHK86_000341 [Glycine max]KAH1161469.1 hypothetical protein GYH30_000373 [Glycine max]KAH1264408.1 hypothetical protein GmHk_01G000336 [Glycine max]